MHIHPSLDKLETRLQPSVLTQLFDPVCESKGIELWIKRDDLIHPIISGNKWRKLKYILDYVLKNKHHTVISMGGAYSNHLHALAYVTKLLDLKSIAYIRGERPDPLNPTLADLQKWGMELRFISRNDYKKLRLDKAKVMEGEFWLPEGGAMELALQGVGEMVTEIDSDFDILCVPCGTGATLAGIIDSVSDHSYVVGFSALKGGGFLIRDVYHLLENSKKRNNWTIQLDYHFGGFAKSTAELFLFIEKFFNQHGIELEPVYTGKMFYGLFDLINKDSFKPGQKIVVIHTGGLQGKRNHQKNEFKL